MPCGKSGQRALKGCAQAQVGKAGGVLERDARAAGGEAGEKADGQAGEARGRAAGMGRDGRGGLPGLHERIDKKARGQSRKTHYM